jgi:hypothetical protein
VLGNGGTRELLTQQAGEVHHRGARPIARHDVLGLAGVVALDQDDTTERLAVDFSDVVLDPAVVAIGADELELLLTCSAAGRALSSFFRSPFDL